MSTFTRRTLVRAAAAGEFGVLTSCYGAVGRAGQNAKNTAGTVRAASASVRLTDDNMAELHARQKIFSRPWEGEFRANALILDAGQRICLLSLEALGRDRSVCHLLWRVILAITSRITRAALCVVLALNVAGSLSADEDWRQFRGPTGEGHTRASHLPLTWNENHNVVWKTAIHDRGWSSPVICGNQIWMTAATGDGHKLFAACVDRETGKIVHDLHVFNVERPQRIAAENTYATPTPVIESGRVYVHYGTYGTACLNSATGSIVWTRRDLNCDHENGAGPCSSPFLLGNMLIVNVDGRDVQYMIALDTSSGKTVWKTDRSFDYATVPVNRRKAFSMPLLVPRGAGRQLVSTGGQAVYAYDPLTGKELWKVRHHGFSAAPRPVYGHGLVFLVTDYDHPELWAVRVDGSGDVTDSHVAWKETRGIPSRSSPLLVDDLLYVISHPGILSCLEAKTGETVWKNRLEGKYSASAIHAGNRIYLFNENAVCTVIRPGRKFEELAVNRLNGQSVMASPAVAGDSFFIRTEKHLYRVEETTK